MAAGKVAVITGAASGIGLAAARHFAGLGMHVLMADIDGGPLEAAAADVRAVADRHGSKVASRQVDVAQFAEVVGLKELAFATFGRVDVLMNNAGTSRKTGSWDALDQWHQIINVNLWGVIHGVHAFAQALIDQHTPALIVNTGSKQGITNPPGNPAYNVSKAGVKFATEALQHTLRNTPGCRVSAHLLVPGYTFTGMTAAHAQDKPAGAWSPEQVVDFMIAALARGSFYIICPDNEVSSAEDARRILWAAGDLAHDRPALSRWDPAYREGFKQFEV
jgi:NAD(P)-dependent dehydrogenase (short-subunit alcohol dehydrogenase family)